MYPEFIAIYIMLALVLVGLGAVIFLLLKVLNGNSGSSQSGYSFPQQSIPTQPSADAYYAQQPTYQSAQQPVYAAQQAAYPAQGGVVFCKQCATQFDASQAYCPQCGTRR